MPLTLAALRDRCDAMLQKGVPAETAVYIDMGSSRSGFEHSMRPMFVDVREGKDWDVEHGCLPDRVVLW